MANLSNGNSNCEAALNDDNDCNVEEKADTSNDGSTREKSVVATGVTGQVKWFNMNSRYGFVCRDDNNEDVFIHSSAIKKFNPRKYPKSVGENERLMFDVVRGEKGCEAINVTSEDGEEVKGSDRAWDIDQVYYRSRRGGRRGYYQGRPFNNNGPVRGGPSGDASHEGREQSRRNVDRGRGRSNYYTTNPTSPSRGSFQPQSRGERDFTKGFQEGGGRDVVSYDRATGANAANYVISRGGRQSGFRSRPNPRGRGYRRGYRNRVDAGVENGPNSAEDELGW